MSIIDYAFAHQAADDGRTDRDLAAPPRTGRHVHASTPEPIYRHVAALLHESVDGWSARAGVDAEAAVGQFLAGLGTRWHVLHGVPLDGRGEIAHVVIGPAGVFTVSTRHHPGALLRVDGDTVTVNGCDQRCVRAARHEANHAAVLLTARALFDVEVRGIVAVTGARAVLPLSPPRGVDVIEAHELVHHLRTLPDVLGTPSVERIYDIARHLATWQPDVAWAQLAG
jgi:hypothetical protein